MDALSAETKFRRTKLNLANYKRDTLEQYAKKESIRFHEVPQKSNDEEKTESELSYFVEVKDLFKLANEALWYRKGSTYW